MLGIVLRKELMQLARDRWLCIGLGIFAATVLSSLLWGIGSTQAITQRQMALQEKSRDEWLKQDSTTGHSATHFGTTLYKLPHPLFAFDAGSDRHLGTAVRVESHRPLPATDPISVGSLHPLHFDISTPALLLQLVCPLVVILLTFAAVTKDREQGILPLVMSTGISWRFLIFAKMLKALLVICVLISVPLIAMGGFAFSVETELGVDRLDLAVRLALLGLSCWMFLGGWAFLSLVVSARSHSSSSSLLTLLTLWTISSIVIPRVAVEFAYQQNPLPHAVDLDQTREELAQFGHEGRSILERLRGEVDDKYKRQYSVVSVEELPLKMSALYLTAVEDFTDEIYDEQMWKLENKLASQDRLVHSMSLISPYMAIRSISTALCGTDRIHHQAFYDSTERHRRMLVRKMNDFDARNVARVTPDKKVWESVPPYYFRFLAASGGLNWQSIPITILFIWFLATGLWAIRKPRLFAKRS